MHSLRSQVAWGLGMMVVTAAPLAWGQAPSIFSVTGEWAPPSGVQFPDSLQDLTADVEPDIQVSTLDVRFNVPIRLTDKALLMPGASYGIAAFSQSNSVFGEPENRELHSVMASILFNYRFNESWSLTLQAAPGLAGDFADLDGGHFRVAGLALVDYRFSPRFSLGGGIGFSYQFGEPLPLPVLRVDWRISDSVRLTAMLPQQTMLVWRPHDRVELGLMASIRGQSYALTSEAVQGQWPCRGQAADVPATPFDERQADANRCFSTLAFSRGEVGPVASVRLVSSLWLSVKAGFLFFRRYEFLNEDGETSDIGDFELDQTVSVMSQLTFRIPNT